MTKAIAGISGEGQRLKVMKMLKKMTHRGRGSMVINEHNTCTMGMIAAQMQNDDNMVESGTVSEDRHCTKAFLEDDVMILRRDPLGIEPIYYGRNENNELCFASEVKSLLEVTHDVNELLPGTTYDGSITKQYFKLQTQPECNDSAAIQAKELLRRLNDTIKKSVTQDTMGAWLSGGLDSSVITALARPHVKTLHTFVAGLPGAPDIEAARSVADFLKTTHHEVVITENDLLQALPAVIYYLESFDALLVRSSITNYLAAQVAGYHVSEVFSGEGGDELFAGYTYLKSMPSESLADELIDITNRLHNTALQRVDRCASAHGLSASVSFLDPAVVEFALQVPVEYKLHDGVEKWIVRQAITGLLPQHITDRPKAKFWEGAGVTETLATYANNKISDAEFAKTQLLPNGWKLSSKEEMMYYQIFHDHFGDMPNLNWMGRTKGATPVNELL